MTRFLCKLFIKNCDQVNDPEVRRAYGTLTSVVGILLNVLLAAAKFLAGILSGAIAITADAVNNLSDAGSQLISLISFKIAAKPADRDHPFGHARMEYVASMIVSFLILHVGFELLTASVEKILSPSPTKFSMLTVIILCASIAVKLWIALFNYRIGKRIDSSILRATATDSLSDTVSTTAVLISMLVAHFSGWDPDAYMGILVSVLIFVAGIRILNDTKNSILGKAPDPILVESILKMAREFPEILGVHDMVVHQYGANNVIASLHAEVDGSADVFVTHDVIDTLEKRLYSRLGIRATVHMDPIVTDDETVNALRGTVAAAVKTLNEKFLIHDFRMVVGVTHSNLIFDVSVPFEESRSDTEIREAIANVVAQIDPNYFTVLTIDRE